METKGLDLCLKRVHGSWKGNYWDLANKYTYVHVYFAFVWILLLIVFLLKSLNSLKVFVMLVLVAKDRKNNSNEQSFYTKKKKNDVLICLIKSIWSGEGFSWHLQDYMCVSQLIASILLALLSGSPPHLLIEKDQWCKKNAILLRDPREIKERTS
jgi:hypothetical protein